MEKKSQFGNTKQISGSKNIFRIQVAFNRLQNAQPNGANGLRQPTFPQFADAVMMRNTAPAGDNFVPGRDFDRVVNGQRVRNAPIVEPEIKVNTSTGIVNLCHSARSENRIFNSMFFALPMQ